MAEEARRRGILPTDPACALRELSPSNTLRNPSDVLTICVEESTYDCRGTNGNATSFQLASWTRETTDLAYDSVAGRVYANEGLCKILFFRSGGYHEISATNRKST
jgi:hypothetical protein